MDKNLPEEIKDNFEKFQEIIDSSPFPVALVDQADNKIFYWSQSAKNLFGHTAPTTLEWYRLAYPDPDYRNEVIARWKLTLEKARNSAQTVNAGEYRVTCNNGTFRICELYLKFIKDYLVVTFNDVTENKKREEAFSTTQKDIVFEQTFIKSALDALPGIFYMFDNEGGFLRWNQNFSKISGYSDTEIKKILPIDLFEGEDKKKIAETIQTVFKTGYSETEAFLVSKKGVKKPFFFNGSKFALDGKEYLVGMGTDIANIKKIEQDLIESKIMLQRIIDLLPMRIFWKDMNLNFLGCNAAFAKDAGEDKVEDLVGKDDFAMVWKDQAEIYRADDKKVLDANKPVKDFEELQTTPDGKTIWWLTNKIPLTDVHGNVKGILGTYNDITGQKQAQAEILKRSEQLSRFNDLMVGREMKMLALKKTIEELKEKLKKHE